jgi:hypothetical protein
MRPDERPQAVGREGTACRALFDNQDSMEMIRHDDEGIQLDTGEMVRDGLPTLGNNFADRHELDHKFHDICEQAKAVARANRDEIGTRLGVIVVPEADRPAMTFGTLSHGIDAGTSYFAAPSKSVYGCEGRP